MKRIHVVVAAVAAALAVPVYASAQQPAPGENPWPGRQLPVLLHVDTVTASPGESKYGVSYPKRCTWTNLFRRGEGAVFRVWGIEASTGKVLTPSAVKYAYVKIPGQPNLKLRFGPHGRTADAPWFWAARWDIPLDYPLGQVEFRVVIKTKLNNFGIWDQPKVFGDARLAWMEIVEQRP